MALLIPAFSNAIGVLNLSGNDWQLRSTSIKIENATVPGMMVNRKNRAYFGASSRPVKNLHPLSISRMLSSRV